MEDYKLDIIIGKGPSAKSIRIDIAPLQLLVLQQELGYLPHL